MSELLPCFDSEFEVVGGSPGPTLGSFGVAWPVESRIDLNRVEVPGIELQFVCFQKRVEETGP
jgi:hypothetical protein